MKIFKTLAIAWVYFGWHYDGETGMFIWHSWAESMEFAKEDRAVFFPKDRDRFERFGYSAGRNQ